MLGSGASSQGNKVNVLSSRLKDKEEKIQEIIAELIEEASKGKPFIVEGKKDLQALQQLGIEGKVVMVKTGGKSFLESVEDIEKLGVTEVILLLDFDRRGKEGTKRLKKDLERLKIKVNSNFWRRLLGLLGSDVQCMESLPNYMSTLKLKINGSSPKKITLKQDNACRADVLD
jgi:5S rRNA maturation endonuclease (ribonuclease M5)